MRDRQSIQLSDIAVTLRVGVTAEERANPQVLRLSLTIEHEPGAPYYEQDRLDATLDYAQIIAFLREDLPALGPFALIETVADRAAEFVLRLSSQVEAVEVRVAKPSVLAAHEGAVAVSLLRTAHGRLANRARPGWLAAASS